MGPLAAAAALAAALPVALLPPDSSGVPAEAVKAAAQSLQRALPAPWVEAKVDLAALAEHLAAAGPACRSDLVCLCSVVPFDEGAVALDLRLASLAPLRGWSADLRLVRPCSGEVLGRRAAAVEPAPAALSRFTAEAAAQLLRGRDLGGIRWSGKAGMSVEPSQPAPAQARPIPELPRLELPRIEPVRKPVLPDPQAR